MLAKVAARKRLCGWLSGDRGGAHLGSRRLRSRCFTEHATKATLNQRQWHPRLLVRCPPSDHSGPAIVSCQIVMGASGSKIPAGPWNFEQPLLRVGPFIVSLGKGTWGVRGTLSALSHASDSTALSLSANGKTTTSRDSLRLEPCVIRAGLDRR